ncbi:hypothetical protein EVAR_86891_1 [Eumeta japonica]|uniref:Uncharacterized protein n=1 Tax=Eumeta variegata TaxID=151549 RepID=A0A4C1ZHN2_EUMVA|nr:hypothetical protein EVAR_86891_1 [Eumeta japonica]
MDIRNPRRVTSTLPASLVGVGHVTEGRENEWAGGGRRLMEWGTGPTEGKWATGSSWTKGNNYYFSLLCILGADRIIIWKQHEGAAGLHSSVAHEACAMRPHNRKIGGTIEGGDSNVTRNEFASLALDCFGRTGRTSATWRGAPFLDTHKMAKQLQVLAGLEDHYDIVLNEMRSAMGEIYLRPRQVWKGVVVSPLRHHASGGRCPS